VPGRCDISDGQELGSTIHAAHRKSGDPVCRGFPSDRRDGTNSEKSPKQSRRISPAPLTSLDSWFYQPGVVDLATGLMTRIPFDFQGDFRFESWTSDGHIVAGAQEFRSSIWKIQPADR
jgi:hypothetical protein